MTHELKTLPQFFRAVRNDTKPFEVRLNDRNFAVGDLLLLLEWDGEAFTHECCARVVTYVLQGGQFGIEPGYVVMGLRHLCCGEAPQYRDDARARFWLGLPEEPKNA